MLTSDENLVDINIAVQYRRAEPVAYAFNVRDPDQTLEEVSESAIREIVGRSQLDFVLEQGRQEITAKTKELVQRTLDAYKTGIEVTTVNLQGVSVPEQVQSSQRDAIKAREDQRAARRSRRRPTPTTSCRRRRARRRARARTPAPTRRASSPTPRARRSASRNCCESYERAPGVTRQRLYYETMEEVLGNTNKVLVDTKAGTGNMIYLPLDKLTRRPRAHADARRTAPGAGDGASRARRRAARRACRQTVESRRDRGTR